MPSVRSELAEAPGWTESGRAGGLEGFIGGVIYSSRNVGASVVTRECDRDRVGQAGREPALPWAIPAATPTANAGSSVEAASASCEREGELLAARVRARALHDVDHPGDPVIHDAHGEPRAA